mmetsp:Transcript_15342/g.22541  ORF Transcript_15342/g.22541 Transcript_15342/m.22541 type:complete len:80 (+) Transcript_15342:154-393(+)
MHTLQLELPTIATLTIESICCSSNIPIIVVLHLTPWRTWTCAGTCIFEELCVHKCGQLGDVGLTWCMNLKRLQRLDLRH